MTDIAPADGGQREGQGKCSPGYQLVWQPVRRLALDTLVKSSAPAWEWIHAEEVEAGLVDVEQRGPCDPTEHRPPRLGRSARDARDQRGEAHHPIAPRDAQKGLLRLGTFGGRPVRAGIHKEVGRDSRGKRGGRAPSECETNDPAGEHVGGDEHRPIVPRMNRAL